MERARIRFGGKEAQFNAGTTKWLGVLLDSTLTLRSHFLHRLGRAKHVERRIRALCSAQGLPAGLARRLQKATVPAIALYGAELWWQGQKDRLIDVQKLTNHQARAVTGMLRSTPIGALIREAALDPAEVLLNARRVGYAVRLLTLPEEHPAAQLLPQTFRHGDEHVQPNEQPLDDREWASRTLKAPLRLGQQLAKQLSECLRHDPSGGIERTSTQPTQGFPGVICMPERQEALDEAAKQRPGTTLWSDGSRLQSGRVGAGVAYQALPGASWEHLEIPMGVGKEAYDAELTGVTSALEWAIKRQFQGPIHVFLDSQAAINRLREAYAGGGQEEALRAHSAARKLAERGQLVTIHWVPGHSHVPGNEQADQAARSAASKPARGSSRLSLAYIRRAYSEAKAAIRARWIAKTPKGCPTGLIRAYKLPPGWGIEPEAAKAPKSVVRHYYQLKTGHAPVGAYLHRVKRRESAACSACHAPNETVRHLILECPARSEARRKLYRTLRSEGVPLPTAAEDCPEARLFVTPKATKALLQFITEANLFGATESANQRAVLADRWGLSALEEEGIGDVLGTRSGEG